MLISESSISFQIRYALLLRAILVLTWLLAISCGDDNPVKPEPSPLTVTDIDGNVYRTVRIGTQVWMAENLKVTHYRNGEAIPNVTDQGSWQNLATDAQCVYGNSKTNLDDYGRLYNWYAIANSRNIAPDGWHVPTYDDCSTLVAYLDGYQVAGGKLKEEGADHWANPNTGATDESGFKALPGGRRDPYGFTAIGFYGYFWILAEGEGVIGLFLRYDRSYASIYSSAAKEFGLSVRCIKD